MVKLDFENAEELIFRGEGMRAVLPEFAHLFDQYDLGVRVPALRQLGRRSILEFLERAGPGHLDAVAARLGFPVSKDDHDFRIVESGTFSLENLCDSLCGCRPLAHFCIGRDETGVGITFWR